MVLQLNDLTGLKDSYWLKQMYNNGIVRISHDVYPEQVTEALGKKVHLDYLDYEGHHRGQRLSINKDYYTEYDGETCQDIEQWWTILRYDKPYQFTEDEGENDEQVGIKNTNSLSKDKRKGNENTIPGKAILVGPKNKIIVTSTREIERMCFYPEYTMSTDELYLPRARDWKQFNRERKLDKVHPIPVQHLEYLYMPVMTEYYHDIIKYDSIVNRMPESSDQHPTFDQIKEHLYISDPDLQKNKVPNEILKSFPLYYSRHEHHNLDIPRRAINYGVVIRCDESNLVGGDGLAIAEIMEDGTKRYVTGSEAFIYFDTDSKKVKL